MIQVRIRNRIITMLKFKDKINKLQIQDVHHLSYTLGFQKNLLNFLSIVD